MTDRELLELAANGAGYPINDGYYDNGYWVYVDGAGDPPNDSAWTEIWNPITDDGDAFRLAVKLYLFDGSMFSHLMQLRLDETRRDPSKTDEEIMRRAIVRAAAEIGKSM